MQQPFETTFTPDMCSVDFTGRWQPGSVFRAMQEAAGAHCDTLGLSYRALQAQGLAWVLSRARVQMDVYPELGQPVRVQTWAGATRHLFFPRHYRFYAGGAEIGRASTLYVLLDIASRKITLPSRLMRDLPVFDLPAPLSVPGTVRPREASQRHDYRPVYTDLDMNGHVNNTRYIDWLMNLIPVEEHARFFVSELLVSYNSEVVPREPLRLELAASGDVRQLSGWQEDTLCFVAEGHFRAR